MTDSSSADKERLRHARDLVRAIERGDKAGERKALAALVDRADDALGDQDDAESLLGQLGL